MSYKSTASLAAHQTTDQLFETAHRLLCGGYWADARGALDALAARVDVKDTLADLTAYNGLAVEAGAPDLTSRRFWAYRTVLADRIADINWRVGRRRADPTAGY